MDDMKFMISNIGDGGEAARVSMYVFESSTLLSARPIHTISFSVIAPPGGNESTPELCSPRLIRDNSFEMELIGRDNSRTGAPRFYDVGARDSRRHSAAPPFFCFFSTTRHTTHDEGEGETTKDPTPAGLFGVDRRLVIWVTGAPLG